MSEATQINIGRLADFHSRHFAVSACLSPAIQRSSSDARSRSVFQTSCEAVNLISAAARSRHSFARAVIDWEQFRAVLSPFGLIDLAERMCSVDSTLFVQFSAGEFGTDRLVSSDAANFLELTGAQTSIRINQAYFGDAADVVTEMCPSLVSLDFTGHTGPLSACTEILDILEAASACGSWVSIPSSLPPPQREWLRIRGATLIEDHRSHNPFGSGHMPSVPASAERQGASTFSATLQET